MATRRIRAGEIELNVVDEGSGSAVLLIHGFPDSSHLWRHQIPVLVSAGFRAIAPDLRGFGESDKPAQVEAYRLMKSVNDMLALLDALGIGRAHVVCHDFGAAVGWLLASLHPDRVERFVPLSVGNPYAFASAGLAQRLRSWYMAFFQLEGVAESAIRLGGWRGLRFFARNHPECEHWIADLSRPGALTAALNWYRANARSGGKLASRAPMPKVRAPTLGIWPSGDAYLTEAQMTGSAAYVSGSWRYQRLEGASHWLQLDRPDEVNRLVLDFFRAR